MVLSVLRGNNLEHLAAFSELAGKGMMGEYRLLVAVERRRLQLEKNKTAAKMRLANALRHVGKYDEAEPLYRTCLAARKETLGEKHPDTLDSVNNLAGLLESQGKYDEAERILTPEQDTR